MIQRTLGGRYLLEESIGNGGMAEVYRAQDNLLDRTVAVKILHAAYQNDTEFIEKFHREAKAAACMSHPNIVNIYDVGADGEDHYIVMEYVPGSTLKKKIQDEAPLDIPTAVHIAKDIADGLAHAHANNIVHCDIKPHNILMTSDNRAKIADFGIARAVTESTMTYSGSVVGSVHYFSPEQARGSGITPKSDVYSLGIVMYEMLTNHLPFNADNPVSIAMKHVEEEPTPLSVWRPQISPILEAIVLRAMNKNPDVRPSSFELVQELANVEKTLGVSKEVDPDATQVLQRVETPVSVRRMVGTSQPKIQDAEVSNTKQSFFKSKLFMAGLVLVLLIGFGIGSIISFGSFGKQEEVVVPEVVGKQLALARQILEDGKLRVNVAETYDASVPPGQVVSQDPIAGRSVKVERLVTIYVSKGGEDLDMPDLAGLSKSAAIERLHKAGLVLGSVYEKYANEEPGTVLSHDPSAGTKIYRGQTIDLTISRGIVGSPYEKKDEEKSDSKDANSSDKKDTDNQTDNTEGIDASGNRINYSETEGESSNESQNEGYETEATEVFTSGDGSDSFDDLAPSRDDLASKQR
ncbi:MAG: Stk1 family PASTA domain-containing Ser/Thr kinase [Selenomonadaceae bacterium]|nr:Stk1 family PASTA domain-containing Ser/Thr kinase [Selenomonadaceae bacterium]